MDRAHFRWRHISIRADARQSKLNSSFKIRPIDLLAAPGRASPSFLWGRRAFKGLPRVKQHQLVYAALKGRMGGELHALALETSAPN
jgi:hypothetical protein